ESTVEWMGEHLSELKQSVSGPGLLYQSLVLGFVIGLAAHIGGYMLAASVHDGILGLLADLLLALGWSLWTGVVVTVFVEVIPEVKRHQIQQAVEAYEAMRRKRAAGKRGTAAMKKPHVKPSRRKQAGKNR